MFAGLPGRATDVGTTGNTLPFFAGLFGRTLGVLAGIGDTLSLLADLTRQTRKARVKAGRFCALSLNAEGADRTQHTSARIRAGSVTADFSLFGARVLEGLAISPRDTDLMACHILAGGLGRTRFVAGGGTYSAHTNKTFGTGGLFIDTTITVVVQSVAYFLFDLRGITRTPLAIRAKLNPSATGGLAGFDQRLLGVGDVVEDTIAVIVQTVAGFLAGGFVLDC